MGLGRVELPTYGLGNRRSIHLSYSPAIGVRLVYIHLGKRRGTFQIRGTPKLGRIRSSFCNEMWTLGSNADSVQNDTNRLLPYCRIQMPRDDSFKIGL